MYICIYNICIYIYIYMYICVYIYIYTVYIHVMCFFRPLPTFCVACVVAEVHFG